ncbi:hypothetical protein [Robertkochia aurantiaca]|uniref:hypothetical protein n=1 Tax=Robertkochia aurantiaca TaxID=2873700 RepID=UPI001CCE910D|nr:hypothetical protein [Robertkochia sp. 3YJGBD-33]
MKNLLTCKPFLALFAVFAMACSSDDELLTDSENSSCDFYLSNMSSQCTNDVCTYTITIENEGATEQEQIEVDKKTWDYYFPKVEAQQNNICWEGLQ